MAKSFNSWLSSEGAALNTARDIDAYLAGLNLGENVVKYIYALSVKSTLPFSDNVQFASQVRVALAHMDAETAFIAGPTLSTVTLGLVNALNGRPTVAVAILRDAVRIVESGMGGRPVLTPIHVHLLRACLLAKTYTAALKIARHPFTDFSPPPRRAMHAGKKPPAAAAAAGEGGDGGDVPAPVLPGPGAFATTSEDAACFFFYSGNVLSACDDLDAALAAYEIAYSLPLKAVSAVAVEAFKRATLLSVFRSGSQELDLRAHVPSAISRSLTQAVKGYRPVLDLVRARPADVESCLAAVNARAESYAADGNLGLVRRVVESSPGLRAAQLARIYSRAPVAKVVARASMGPGADSLAFWIARGIVRGQIDRRTQVITYGTAAAGGSSASEASGDFARVETLLRSVAALTDAVQKLDRDRLQTHPRAIAKKADLHRKEALPRGAGNSALHPSADAGMDEDGDVADAGSDDDPADGTSMDLQ